MEPSHTTIEIGNRIVGGDHPCFIIAEAGVNHNGSVTRAHELVDMAAEGGADAVKFQTFKPSELVSDLAHAAPYQRQPGVTTQRAMLEALVLPPSAWKELAQHAAERSLLFMSTAFDPGSLDMLIDLGVQALKVPSGELDNTHYIKTLASKGLPLIISTGLGTLDEVKAAYAAAREAPGIAILHCVTAYPAPVETSNLRAIQVLTHQFRVPIGWSDHTDSYTTAVAAVALGASILEKHITVDKALPGPDHAASSNPAEFGIYVAAVRAIESGLGDGVKQPTKAELINRDFVRRSFHATRSMRAGEIVGPEDVNLLRPGIGLPPTAQIVGRTLRRDVEAGKPLLAEDF